MNKVDNELDWVTFSSSDNSIPCEGFDTLVDECSNEAVWIVYARGCPNDKSSTLCDPCCEMLKEGSRSGDEFMCAEHGKDVIFTRIERIPR